MNVHDIISEALALGVFGVGLWFMGYWRGRTVGTRTERERWEAAAKRWSDESIAELHSKLSPLQVMRAEQERTAEPGPISRYTIGVDFAAGTREVTRIVEPTPDRDRFGVPKNMVPCGTKGCGAEAMFDVHWPAQRLNLCLACTERAKIVASHMGFELSCTVLPAAT
jgi:hypothetical protein